MKMSKTQALRVLVRSFMNLDRRSFANLRYHIDKGTPILCGDEAFLFASSSGGL